MASLVRLCVPSLTRRRPARQPTALNLHRGFRTIHAELTRVLEADVFAATVYNPQRLAGDPTTSALDAVLDAPRQLLLDRDEDVFRVKLARSEEALATLQRTEAQLRNQVTALVRSRELLRSQLNRQAEEHDADVRGKAGAGNGTGSGAGGVRGNGAEHGGEAASMSSEEEGRLRRLLQQQASETRRLRREHEAMVKELGEARGRVRTQEEAEAAGQRRRKLEELVGRARELETRHLLRALPDPARWRRQAGAHQGSGGGSHGRGVRCGTAPSTVRPFADAERR